MRSSLAFAVVLSTAVAMPAAAQFPPDHPKNLKVLPMDIPVRSLLDTMRYAIDAAGLDFIRLATPTNDDKRLPQVLKNTQGFLYYVAVAGVTGTKSAAGDVITAAVTRLKKHTDLPVAVGFGIRTPAQAAAVAKVADAAVVGSALVDRVASSLDAHGKATSELIKAVLGDVQILSQGVRSARFESKGPA